jgi:hypothetical protein
MIERRSFLFKCFVRLDNPRVSVNVTNLIILSLKTLRVKTPETSGDRNSTFDEIKATLHAILGNFPVAPVCHLSVPAFFPCETTLTLSIPEQ